MLALTFFVSVFSTVIWLIYAALFINDKIQGVPLMNLGLLDASIYLAFLLLPVFFLWIAFGHINQYISNKNVYYNLSSLMKQMKKNMDYTDLVARILLEAEQEIKDGFILNKFDIFIADMNEVLSEIIRRCSLASSEQIENLWTKVQNGGKWSFGKVIIEISQNQTDFAQRTVNRAKNDVVLAGSLLEFSARYQNLINLLERHDREHVFLNMVETGVFGKVFSIIEPIADEVKKAKLASNNSSSTNSNLIQNTAPIANTKEDELKLTPFSHKNSSFVSKLNVFKKKTKDNAEKKLEPQIEQDKDPFTIALERSFGSTISASNDDSLLKNEAVPVEEQLENSFLALNLDNEKIFDWHDDNQLDIEDFTNIDTKNNKSAVKNNVAQFSETRKTLNSLRKEFSKTEPSFSKTKNINEESLITPFSNWTDEIAEKN